MKNCPLVSVIIPTYNRAAVICHSIESVLRQTYSNTEVIVVDDGSTDDTQLRLKRFGERIRIVTQPNAGPGAARNLGIRLSRGEIIAFQDSDDLWKPTKLERQVRLLESLDASVPCCLCNATFQFRDGRATTVFDISSINARHDEVIWSNVAEVLATRFVLFNQMVAIRRSALQRTGGFDETLRYLEDYDLSLRLAFEGPWALIREPLVIYREGSPDSLARRSVQDEVVMKQYEMKIFNRVLTKLSAENGHASTRRYFVNRLRIFRWGLRAAQLSQGGSWGSRAAGNVGTKILHSYNKAFRRSPWCPTALTRPVNAAPSLTSESNWNCKGDLRLRSYQKETQ
jgi:glycosyltransferase involved in cell wall biosynthesis